MQSPEPCHRFSTLKSKKKENLILVTFMIQGTISNIFEFCRSYHHYSSKFKKLPSFSKLFCQLEKLTKFKSQQRNLNWNHKHAQQMNCQISSKRFHVDQHYSIKRLFCSIYWSISDPVVNVDVVYCIVFNYCTNWAKPVEDRHTQHPTPQIILQMELASSPYISIHTPQLHKVAYVT